MNTNHDALREALELLRIFKNNLGPDRASLSAADAILWDRVEALSRPMPEGAKPEREIEQLIRERDQRDEIIDRLCDAVLGSERPEWSSAYGFDDAVADVEARITQLHQPSVDKAWKRFEQANAAQPPHPKPQAQGEPEWRLTNHYKADVDKAKKEALAQHRAALEKCVGALEDLRNEVHDSNTFDQPGAFVCCDMPCDGAHSDNCKASAAITNANQVLGKGEV